MTERKRQWEVCEASKAINHKLAFVSSDNSSAPGRFMEESFSEKDETNSASLPTRRTYHDYSKLPNFLYLSWSETPTFDREPDDFQPRAQIKRFFEGGILVSGDSEAVREFSDKYIVPEKLVAEYVEQMRKEKLKEENRRERMERLNRGTMTLTGLDCTTPTSCRP